MSEVTDGTKQFMTLFDQGKVTSEQINAWHDSGDKEQRLLAEFLGITDDEYAVHTMAPQALPLILAARRKRRQLLKVLPPWIEALRHSGDQATIVALETWLAKRNAA